MRFLTKAAKLQKSAGEGGEIAKIGGVKLQKSAGNFAIMSARLRKFGKAFWNALGKAFWKFFVKVRLDTFASIFALYRLPDQHPPKFPTVNL